MNTNLPLVPRTSDGPTWSNGWAATGTHLDMIAKQYKNGKRKGQEQEKKGVKTGLERGKKGVGMGAKTGFKRYKKRNLAKFENLERRRTAALCCSTSFQPFFGLSSRFLAVPPLFSPVFHDFGQKREKNGCPKMEERERKERVPFPFLSRSHFFPFLAWHISISHHCNMLVSLKSLAPPTVSTGL